MIGRSKSAFTLIELLVVLGIVAVISTVVIVTLNPVELLKQTRDGARISDLNTINSALGTYAADTAGAYTGTSSIVYVSLPDSTSTCANLNLPALSNGWTYNCSTAENYKKADGTGWIPTVLQNVSFGSPLSQLPVDPTNTSSSGFYYTYVTTGTWWELTAILESTKYGPRMVVDGGVSPYVFEQGTDLTLTPAGALDRGIPPNAFAITLASISPTSTTAGDPGFTITILGTNFTSSSVVKWGGTSRTTTFVSDTQLTASILTADVAATGTIAVTVSDPVGGTSGSSDFGISERTMFIAGSWTTDSSGGPVEGDGASIAEANGKFYVVAGNGPTFKEYDTTTKIWSNLTNVPGSWLGNGAAIVKYSSNILFLLKGSEFYKYTIDTNTWTTASSTPAGTAYGAALAYPGTGDYIYAFRGYSQSAFWRYSVSNNSWGESGVAQGDGASIAEANGKYYVVHGYSGTTFKEYNPATNKWSNLTNTPASASSASTIVKYNNTTLYYLAGGTSNFYKYDIGAGSWTTVSSTPAGTAYGAALAYPGTGDYIYAFRGYGTATFWQYSIANDHWSSLTNAPSTVTGGGALTAIGSKVYAFRGQSTATFWEYNIASSTWSVKTSAPAIVSGGASLTNDGTNIYATGGGTNFWKYVPADDLWTTLPVTPVSLAQGGDYYVRGGAAYSPSLNKVYVITGNSDGNSQSIFAYDAASNTWSGPVNAPSTITGGGALTAIGSKVYAFKGQSTATFWEYNIASSTWSVKTSAPAIVSGGASLTNDGTNIYATGGGGTSFWKYVPADNLWTVLASTTATFGQSGDYYCRGGVSYSPSQNAVYGISGNSTNIYRNGP